MLVKIFNSETEVRPVKKHKPAFNPFSVQRPICWSLLCLWKLCTNWSTGPFAYSIPVPASHIRCQKYSHYCRVQLIWFFTDWLFALWIQQIFSHWYSNFNNL